MKDSDLSIVILSWNTRELTRTCLCSLADDDTRHSREVIVVDNASEDGSPDMIAEEFPEVILLRNSENRLYAMGNNQGVSRATGRFLCLLNSDTEVGRGALDRMVNFLERNQEYGAVAPKLLNADGSVQHSCRRFPGLLNPLVHSTKLGQFWPCARLAKRTRMIDFDHVHSCDVEQPPGVCIIMRRQEYLDLGGLDPGLSLFFNDVDLCRRLWKEGRRIRYVAEAEILHHWGASTRQARPLALWHRNREAYYRKHYGAWVVPYLRLIFYIWVARVWLGIQIGPKDAEAKRAALEDLRACLRKCPQI